MNIGKAIKVRMAELDLKPKDLAERMDVTYSYVIAIINNKYSPGLSSIKKIAKGLELSASVLIHNSEKYEDS